jgi:hypothetical protein
MVETVHGYDPNNKCECYKMWKDPVMGDSWCKQKQSHQMRVNTILITKDTEARSFTYYRSCWYRINIYVLSDIFDNDGIKICRIL